MYAQLIHINGFIKLIPNKEVKKPIKREKKIEKNVIKIVIERPLIKNCKLDNPLSSLGFNIYQPQL